MGLSSLCAACTLTCEPYKTIICFYDYCVLVLQLYYESNVFNVNSFSLYSVKPEIDI